MRLVKATSEFEAALTTVQKASFRNIRSKACTTPPTLKDVMELTAEIDCQAHEKHKSSRSFGTRLTNMLQSIQQYAALGDVVVGGSQNLIACGVWAAVRMVLHMSIGYLSHLEKLSMLFMEAGRQAPRYQALALIYPKSKNLQSYLFEYYVVVVELCQTIHKFAQQSTFGQMMSSIKDSDLKGYQSDLQLWSSSIKEEANLQLSQHVADEAQQNSKTRLLISKWSDSAAHRQAVADRIRWLEAYSTYDFQTTWKQTRKIGSTSFLSSWTQYRQWKSDDTGFAMLLSGRLGAGKSVTMANVVDGLNLENNTLVIYFFCRHDLPESLKSRSNIGSLNRQYFTHFPVGSDVFRADVATIDTAGFESMADNPVPHKRKFLLIDGLDECDQRELRNLLQALTSVHNLPDWYLGFSARLSAETPKSLLASHITLKWHFTMPVENPDIDRFVESELSRRLANGQLTVGDTIILPEIRHALITGAKGMFLWVALQLDAICDEVSDDAMREVIKTLPSDLTETYIRILRKASAQDTRKYHIRLFKFIAAAYKPLSLGQIREMAAVIKGSPVWDPRKQINDVTKILRYCGSLIMVDEEKFTVRFVHHSAKSFCQGVLGVNLDWNFSNRDAHQEIGETVVTYLSYGIFDTRLSSRVIPKVEVQKLPEHVIHNAVGRSRLSKTFLKLKQGPSRDIGQVLAKVSQQPDGGNSLTEHPFLAYARKFWLPHTRNLDPSTRNTFKLLESLIKKIDIQQLDLTPHIAGPLDDFQLTHQHSSVSAILWAINHSHLPLFNHLMESEHDYILSFRSLLQKVLFFRAVFKHLSLKQSDSTGRVIELRMAQRLLPIAVVLKASLAVGWMARCIVYSESTLTFVENHPGDNSSKTDEIESAPLRTTEPGLYRTHSLILLAASMRNVPILCRLASEGVATSLAEKTRALALLLETNIDEALLLRACWVLIRAGVSPQSLQENQLYAILHHLTNSSELNSPLASNALDVIHRSLRPSPRLLSQLCKLSYTRGNLRLTVVMGSWLSEFARDTIPLHDFELSGHSLPMISKERVQIAFLLLDNPVLPLKQSVAGVEFLLNLASDLNQSPEDPENSQEPLYQTVTPDDSMWPSSYSVGELLLHSARLKPPDMSNAYYDSEVELERFFFDQMSQGLPSSMVFEGLLCYLESSVPNNRPITGVFFCLMAILMRQIILLHFPKSPDLNFLLPLDSQQRQAGLYQLARCGRLLERASNLRSEGAHRGAAFFLVAFHQLLGMIPHFDSMLDPGPGFTQVRMARMRLWQAMKPILDNTKLWGTGDEWQFSDLVSRLNLALTREPKPRGHQPRFESINAKEPSACRWEKLHVLRFLDVAIGDRNLAWLLECMLARSMSYDWGMIAAITAGLDTSYVVADTSGSKMKDTASKALEILGCSPKDIEASEQHDCCEV
ncbi:hypothetical protein CSOJ01_13505 [Colletotrichum sojae]|uniref:NACHT domain-containing protein n=1 Tax=Colletotrichum sojae TaxID=2175907 RepID=A0A8H6IS77_9PEZI|nr:hypothetical protein CSOJ01_13505 [Colletotrichum sojae]